MNLRLHELSPTHKLAFSDTNNNSDKIYYASNIHQVELGGGAVSGLEVYHIRNGALLVGSNVTQLLPSHILHLLERELRLKEEYGLPDTNYALYDATSDFRSSIIQAISENLPESNSGILLPFEDSDNISYIASQTGLRTLNESPQIAARLNDKVEMLTNGVNHLDNVHVPIGKEVHDRNELIHQLRELNNNKEFEDSILCIKVAFSASGCGIHKGHISDLIQQLEDPISGLNKWLDSCFADQNQRVMIQEYFGNRVISSPGVQFSINDSGYAILGASTQDFASDGVTHMGNTYSPDLLQNHKLQDVVVALIQYCQEQGFRGIMGMDLLIYIDENGDIQVSFMEFNARHTGGVPIILGASFIAQREATELTFAGGNIYTGSASHNRYIEVCRRFIPENGRGVMSISGATIDPNNPGSKAQVIFIGHNVKEIASVRADFERALIS